MIHESSLIRESILNRIISKKDLNQLSLSVRNEIIYTMDLYNTIYTIESFCKILIRESWINLKIDSNILIRIINDSQIFLDSRIFIK